MVGRGVMSWIGWLFMCSGLFDGVVCGEGGGGDPV